MTAPSGALAAALTSSLDPACSPRPDVLVIGAGATGGLAATLLAEAGLQVLVLDAGRRRTRPFSIKRMLFARAPSAVDRLLGWRVARSLLTWRQPVQSQCYAWKNAPEQFVDDQQCPYSTPADQPFIWFRARQLGGRMVVPGHGRQYYRFGPDDLQPTDGLSPSWPFDVHELDRWYSYVEEQVQLTGMLDGLRCLPDSRLAFPTALTATESALKQRIAAQWPCAPVVAGRFAGPIDALETAARTGRLRIRPGAVVREITVDETGVSGARWIDVDTGRAGHTRAPIVVLGASALESTRLLLLSRSARHPHGIGGHSDALGRYLMDHVRIQTYGRGPVIAASEAPPGRCLYLPRFDARTADPTKPGRGFGVQVNHTSGGADRSHFVASAFGEMLPEATNRVTLHPSRCDAWGIPILHIECRHGDAEVRQAARQTDALRELADAAGIELTHIHAAPPPGSANHECGTARMGTDPAHSVLNPHNECWDVPNLYLTDGACLPSQGFVNPTLTLLALTARACDHIVATGIRRG